MIEIEKYKTIYIFQFRACAQFFCIPLHFTALQHNDVRPIVTLLSKWENKASTINTRRELYGPPHSLFVAILHVTAHLTTDIKNKVFTVDETQVNYIGNLTQ